MVSNLKSFMKLKTKNEQEVQQDESTSVINVEDTQHATSLASKTSIGVYLQEARVKSNLSISQVSQQTKIHVHYLEALEREDFSNTPPFIYVKAYVKKLCLLYGVNEDEVLALLEEYETGPGPLPEKLMQDLEETKHVNKEEEKKIKSYIKFIGISALTFIILLFVLGIVLWSERDNGIQDRPLTAVEKVQLTKDIEKLVVPENIKMSELSREKQ